MAASFEPLARVMLVILLNGLWQGALIAAITWIALRLSPRVNASTRYAAWTLALIATLIVPAITSITHISYQSASASRASSVHASGSVKSTTSPVHESHARVSRVSPAPAPALSLQAPSLTIAPPALLTAALFALWMLAAAALLVRLTIALLALERLKRDALPLAMDYRERLEQWQRASGNDRDVRICVTEGIEVPVAVGLFDAMVLLPKHLLDTLEAAEVDQISLHELAHLLRHDDWSNSFQRLATALLFFNPAVWFIARQMDIEREVACDDYVLELTGAVRNYAYCLTKMAEMTAWPHQPLAAPGVFVTRKNISIRIERLLRTGRAIGRSISPATAAAVVAGLAAAFLIMRAVTPVIAFALPEVSPAPVALATSEPIAKSSVAPAHNAAPKKRPEAVETPQHQMRPRIFPSPQSNAHDRIAIDIPAIDVRVPAVNVHVPAKQIVADVDTEQGTHGNCTGCNFSDARMPGKDFTHQNLTGSDFADADLKGARFDGSNLSGANFSNADLRDASFVDANMSGCDLEDARLDGARFDGAMLSGCSVNIKKLSPSQARWFLGNCTGCDFAGANLSGLDLRGIKVTGIDLSGASFRNADLAGATFSGIDFSNVDFSGANLNNTTFSGCEFGGADLRHVDLTHTNFVGSSLSGAVMNR